MNETEKSINEINNENGEINKITEEIRVATLKYGIGESIDQEPKSNPSTPAKRRRQRPIRLTGDQTVMIPIWKKYTFLGDTSFSDEVYEISDGIYSHHLSVIEENAKKAHQDENSQDPKTDAVTE